MNALATAPTGYGQSFALFLHILPRIEATGFDWMLIGALAVSAHAAPRTSLDVDAILATRGEDVRELVASLSDAGLDVELRIGDLEDAVRGMIRIRDSFQNQVDLLLGLKGLDAAAFRRAEKLSLEGRDLRLIGAEDLVVIKLAAGSHQDLADADAVLYSRHASFDRELARRLAKRAGRSVAKRLERMLMLRADG